MSLPTPADLQTLQYGFNGAPFAALQMSSADTKTLAWCWLGAPLVAVAATASSAARPVVFVVT